MSPERWQKINEVFMAALDRPLDERAAFLARACANDEELHRRVEAMLEADRKTELKLDRPAFEAGQAIDHFRIEDLDSKKRNEADH